MSEVAVMRSPCLPEDEGRPSLVRIFASRADAEAWIKRQGNEYFKPGDYYIEGEILGTGGDRCSS